MLIENPAIQSHMPPRNAPVRVRPRASDQRWKTPREMISRPASATPCAGRGTSSHLDQPGATKNAVKARVRAFLGIAAVQSHDRDRQPVRRLPSCTHGWVSRRNGTAPPKSPGRSHTVGTFPAGVAPALGRGPWVSERRQIMDPRPRSPRWRAGHRDDCRTPLTTATREGGARRCRETPCGFRSRPCQDALPPGAQPLPAAGQDTNHHFGHVDLSGAAPQPQPRRRTDLRPPADINL